MNNEKETGSENKVNVEPSESNVEKTGDPGRTPGKAEDEDDESATGAKGR